MKFLTCIIFILSVANLFAQKKETFDLATYTVPAGWKETNRNSSSVGFAVTNNQKGTYCQIGVYASTTSKGSLQADIESEWSELVIKPYKPSAKPELIPPVSENGWDIQAGSAPFEFSGGQSVAMLVTASNHTRCMSVVILTNTGDYQSEIEKFLGSFDLKKMETPAPAAPVPNSSDDKNILGVWTMTSSDQSTWRVNNGVMNYIKRQYILNTNGTYTFTTRTFDPLMDKILLGKESGTFQISGNSLTITPQKSVLEAWSKKGNADQWGNFLSTQNIALEKVTYQFTKHYMSGIQEWQLVLQAPAPTKREGPFSSNSSFKNAYYYSPISASHPLIELPAGQSVGQSTGQETKNPPVSSPAIKSTFAFNTTNFDNGWTSTEQADWVQVVKGNIKILIHYPNKNADEYSPDLMAGLKNAWNILVAPKYSSASNFEFKPISGWQSIEFAEADMVEKTTGKSVHVVLFKKNFSTGRGMYMEFITPDKKTYEQEFGPYRQESFGWEKVEEMAGYNKFAVAAADLNGKWTSNFSGMTQYVNSYTGLDAGATAHSSTETFQFTGNTYHWELSTASGVVGNLKFAGAKSDGTLSLPNNWQIHFSDLEGKPKTYNAYFSCIKGARLLWMEDSTYPGYTAYGKKE